MDQDGQDPAGWRISAASDNVIFFVGFGVWNEQDAGRFCQEFTALVESFGERPWGVMGDGTDWIFGDPGVQNLLRDQNRWIVDHGCRAGCFYTGPGALNRLLLYRLVQPDSEEYQFRVYPHQSKAIEALEHSGFPVTEPQLERFFRGEGTRV
jgi:hypothetical protein